MFEVAYGNDGTKGVTMAGDWIRLYRSMLDHAVFQDDWLCRLFLWCLLKANYQKSQWKGEQLEAGQFVTGRIRGSEELGVSPSKWYRGMHTLAAEPYSVIKLSVNSDWTTVTVCNYTTYQYQHSESEQQTNSERTASEQQADTVKEFNKARNKETAPLPVGLQTPEFEKAWADWKRHRREIKKALTPTQEAKQLSTFAEWGPARAIAAIENTILKGWQGLQEPEVAKGGKQPPKPTSTPIPSGIPNVPRETRKFAI